MTSRKPSTPESDFAILERLRATEGARMAAKAAALRERAAAHEAHALEALAAGDKGIGNTLRLLARIEQLEALIADRHVDWKLGTQRRRQIERWAALGGQAQKHAGNTYSDEQREGWRRLHATEYAKHTQRRAAGLILAREGLPAEAFESVRKALGKNSG